MNTKDETLKMYELLKRKEREANHITLTNEKERDLKRSKPKMRKNTNLTPKKKKRKK